MISKSTIQYVSATLLLVLIVVTMFLFKNKPFELIKDNNTEGLFSNDINVTRVEASIEEARLLVKTSKNNLNILQLCETINQVDTENKVRGLTENLKNTHVEISKNYNELAEEKLISIPKYININNQIEITDSDKREGYIRSKLKMILSKINNQIKQLDTLADITDNVEFKVLAVKNTFKLKSSIDNIEISLNRLK